MQTMTITWAQQQQTGQQRVDEGNGAIRNNQQRRRLQPWITARRGGDSGAGRGGTKTMAGKPSIQAMAKAMDDKEMWVSTTTEHP